MEVTRKRTPEELEHELRVYVNHARTRVGWDWETTNAHCIEEFGAIVQDMNTRQLFRFYKDLCELRKFHEFVAAREAAKPPTDVPVVLGVIRTAENGALNATASR